MRFSLSLVLQAKQAKQTWGDYTGTVIEYDRSYVSMITITNTFKRKVIEYD